MLLQVLVGALLVGSIQLIRRDRRSGRLTGVADPHRGEYAAGY